MHTTPCQVTISSWEGHTTIRNVESMKRSPYEFPQGDRHRCEVSQLVGQVHWGGGGGGVSAAQLWVHNTYQRPRGEQSWEGSATQRVPAKRNESCLCVLLCNSSWSEFYKILVHVYVDCAVLETCVESSSLYSQTIKMIGKIYIHVNQHLHVQCIIFCKHTCMYMYL